MKDERIFEGTSDQLKEEMLTNIYFLDRFPLYTQIRQRFSTRVQHCRKVIRFTSDSASSDTAIPDSRNFCMQCYLSTKSLGYIVYVVILVTTELKAFESVAFESAMNASLFDITANSNNDVSINQPNRSGFYPKEFIGCIKATNDGLGKIKTDYIHSLRNHFQRLLGADSFGSIYGMKGLPCQFDIKCTQGTAFYNTGQMTLPMANFVTIVGENIEKNHTDSTGRVQTYNDIVYII